MGSTTNHDGPAGVVLRLTRPVLLAVVLASLSWAVWSIRIELAVMPLVQADTLLLRRETLSAAHLERLARIDVSPARLGVCHAAALRGAARVAMIGAEEAAANPGEPQSATTLADAERRVRTLLSCRPEDGEGWFMLYWLRLQAEGPTREALRLLEMSYQAAPREPGASLLRNAHALLAANLLSEWARALAIEEFVAMVGGGLESFMAPGLVAAPAAVKSQVVAATAVLPFVQRRQLQRALDRLRSDIAIPGVDASASGMRPERWVR